jgi:hypothetical protein
MEQPVFLQQLVASLTTWTAALHGPGVSVLKFDQDGGMRGGSRSPAVGRRDWACHPRRCVCSGSARGQHLTQLVICLGHLPLVLFGPRHAQERCPRVPCYQCLRDSNLCCDSAAWSSLFFCSSWWPASPPGQQPCMDLDVT